MGELIQDNDVFIISKTGVGLKNNKGIWYEVLLYNVGVCCIIPSIRQAYVKWSIQIAAKELGMGNLKFVF